MSLTPPQKPLDDARDAGQKVSVSRTLLRRLFGDHQFFAAFTQSTIDTTRPGDDLSRQIFADATLRYERCNPLLRRLADEAGIDPDNENLDD